MSGEPFPYLLKHCDKYTSHMATLIVPNVARYAVTGLMSGRAITNVFDVRIFNLGATVTRAEAVEDQAGVFVNQWKADIVPQMVNNYSFTQVSWVDLNSADGTVGIRTSTGTTTLPQAGGSASEPLPANVATLVRKLTVSARGARKGRTYWYGANELATVDADPNTIISATVTGFQTSWNNFFGNVNQDASGILFNYDSRLCVVHITERDGDGHPTAGVSTDVTSFSVQARLATQRRRLRS